MIFLDTNLFFLLELGLTLIYSSENLQINSSEFEIPIPVESYDKNNCRNFYDDEKRIISKPWKISIPSCNSTILRLYCIIVILYDSSNFNGIIFRIVEELKFHVPIWEI